MPSGNLDLFGRRLRSSTFRAYITTRFPYNQGARQSDRAGRFIPLQPRKQSLRCLAPEIVEIHVDGRERRPCVRRNDFPIVEADDGDIIWNLASALTKPVHHPAGDDVAAAEDSIDL